MLTSRQEHQHRSAHQLLTYGALNYHQHVKYPTWITGEAYDDYILQETLEGRADNQQWSVLNGI